MQVGQDLHDDPDTEPGDGQTRAPYKPLYRGDTGSLPIEARRVLVHLIRGPDLNGRLHSHLWSNLITHEVEIRSRLHDLFLDLAIDYEGRVALIDRADTGELDVPVLMRRAQLKFLESVVLLYLRQRLAKADAEGVRAIVEEREVVEAMRVYAATDHKDMRGYEKKIPSALQKLYNHSLLQKVGENWEVTPAVKMILTAEAVQALTESYLRMAKGEAPAATTAAGTTTDSEADHDGDADDQEDA